MTNSYMINSNMTNSDMTNLNMRNSDMKNSNMNNSDKTNSNMTLEHDKIWYHPIEYILFSKYIEF